MRQRLRILFIEYHICGMMKLILNYIQLSLIIALR
jgi:hypothetical protein